MIGEPLDFEMSNLGSVPIESVDAHPFRTLVSKWVQQAQELKSEAHVYFCALKHPEMPWRARLVAACTAGYLVSPIQLIPSFIPVIGFLDDFIVLFCGAKLLQRITPPGILDECRERVKAAEHDRATCTASLAARLSFFAVSAIWFLAAIAGAAFVALHFRH